MEQTHPLCSVAGIQERLRALGIQPNRALGQNFLADAGVLQEMLQAIPVKGARVLEIGPGLGALTQGLLQAGAGCVVAVEKDAAMVGALQSEFGAEPRLRVLHADALTVERARVRALLGEEGPLLVAGNLPYYITTPLCLRLLGGGLPATQLLLMVQQEAAQRFFALPGDRVYGPLAILAQCGYEVRRVLHVPQSAYYPQPEVQSAVVRLTKKDALTLPAGFLPFLEQVFRMRRKTLYNNLCAMGTDPKAAHAWIARADLQEQVRAEAIPPMKLLQFYFEKENASS